MLFSPLVYGVVTDYGKCNKIGFIPGIEGFPGQPNDMIFMAPVS